MVPTLVSLTGRRHCYALWTGEKSPKNDGMKNDGKQCRTDIKAIAIYVRLALANIFASVMTPGCGFATFLLCSKMGKIPERKQVLTSS
jgi:hypothetical protein